MITAVFFSFWNDTIACRPNERSGSDTQSLYLTQPNTEINEQTKNEKPTSVIN